MPGQTNHNDIALFKELGKGSNKALIQIYIQYFSTLVVASFRICGDKLLAKEIAFDSLLTLWENRTTVAGNGNPMGWLLRCAKNKSLNALKANQKRRITSLEKGQDIPAPGNIQDKIEADEYIGQISAAIDKLAPKQKIIIELLLDGLSRKQIAAQCNLSESTIKKQIYNAYKNLRKTMKDYPKY